MRSMPGADPVADLVPGLVALRRDLHAHPELAFEERRTAGVVASTLRLNKSVALCRFEPLRALAIWSQQQGLDRR